MGAFPAKLDTRGIGGAIRSKPLVQPLAHHVEAPVNIRERVGGAAEFLYRMGPPLVLLAGDGTVCFVNAAAEALLASTSTLHIRGRQLLGLNPRDQRALTTLRRGSRSLAHGQWSIVVGEAPRTIGVTLTRLSEHVLVPGMVALATTAVFLSDPAARTRVAAAFLQSAFALTPAEAALAEAIIAGGGVRGAANALGIALTTAKTHLQHVLQKTQTRRQAELVRLAFAASAANAQS